MKNIGKIVLIIAGILSVVCLVYTLLQPGAFDASENFGMWMANVVVDVVIYSVLAFFAITVILFAIYKIVDLFKHPSHLKEAMWTVVPILIAVVIGFIFSSNDEIIYGKGNVYPEGMNSKLIGTGLIATGVLIIVPTLFLIYDAIKGVIKG